MIKKLIEFVNNNKNLILLLILSFLIRFIFIFKDLPFITHPDEPTVVNSTLNLKYDLNPRHFDWPTFYYYINYLFFSILYFIERLMNRIGHPFPSIVATENFYLLSRIITCVFGSLSVLFMYLLVLNLTNKKSVGLISAIILSIIPFHITRSAQSLTDVPMLFFIITSLYYLSRNVNEFKWKNIYLSSFFIGLAVSTKYNGYMFALSPIFFIFLIKRFSLKDISNYLYCILLASLGFFIGTPYALIDYKTFLRDDGPKGALWQFKNVGSLGYFEHFSSFISNLEYSLLPDFAFVPWVLGLVFILYFLFQSKFRFKDNYSKFIFILILQFFFIIWSVSGVKIQRSHYFIGAYALVPIFAGLLISKNEKLLNGSLFSTFILSLYLLSFNMFSNSKVEFYQRVVFKNDLKNYNILYTDSELEEVFRKLNVKSDEFDPNIMDFNPKYFTHIVSSQNLCVENHECNYNLIEKIVNVEKGTDLFIYEIKK